MRMPNIFTNRNFTVKLKTQLIASFLFMTVLIVSVVSVLVYNSVLSILKKQSKEQIIQQFRQSEYNINNFRDQMEKIAGVLAINHDVQSFINIVDNPAESARIVAAKEVIKSLDGILSMYPYVYSISIYRRDGEALSNTVRGSWYRKNAMQISPFYSSAIYDRMSKNNYGLQWDGQGDSTLFNISDRVYPNEAPIPLMSIVRKVNLLGNVNHSAVLVISVKQTDFGAIYQNERSEDEGAKYIIDANNTIISNSEQRLIGSKVYQIDRSQRNGSFTSKNGNRSKQITYYQIGGTDWTLVNETPEMEFIRNILTLRQLIGIVMVLSILLAFILSYYWIYRITKPLHHLVFAMREMEKGNLGVILNETPSTELGIIGRRFNKMSLSIEELIEKNKIIEEEKRMLELEALQSQINPHFLYNALNTLKWVAMVRKESSIVDGITTLGNMLRSIYKEKSLMMTLQDEVAYIENYLKIMNARYGEGLHVSIQIPDELLPYKIIRFILQPIVENSIVHGMNSKSYLGTITIAAYRSGEVIMISVSDNGAGIPQDRLATVRDYLYNGAYSQQNSPYGGTGLANVNRRIKLQYGDAYGLTINSDPDAGTEVIVRVPAIQK